MNELITLAPVTLILPYIKQNIKIVLLLTYAIKDRVSDIQNQKKIDPEVKIFEK